MASRAQNVDKYGETTNLPKSDKPDEISSSLLTRITWLKGPQKVEERGENNEFG